MIQVEGAQRNKAWERYQTLPWPTRRDEEWRRTDPGLIPVSALNPEPTATLFQVGWNPVPAALIQAGVIITDLKTAQRQFPELVARYLFKSGAPQGLSKFVALHESLSDQGIFCYIPEGVKVELPLRSWIELQPSGGMIFPHVLVVAGAGAEATLIDERRPTAAGTNGSGAAAAALSDEMVEIFVQPGARLRYLRIQRWGAGMTELYTQRAVVERDAEFLHMAVGLGGKLTKANVETSLIGTGARAELLGLLFGIDHQHYDFHTLQDHQAEHTFSDLLYKSALKDTSKLVYTGLIRIEKNAQKSDAYQANRNLLLSDGAAADSVPMLEILADDVRCTHGVAVGPVDDEQMFYLTSRGLSPAEAERLIVEGFFEQVLQRIPLEEFHEQLRDEIKRRLA